MPPRSSSRFVIVLSGLAALVGGVMVSILILRTGQRLELSQWLVGTRLALAGVFFWLWYRSSVELPRGTKPSRLYSRWEKRRLQGVCVGLSEYLGVRLATVRLLFVVLALSGAGAVELYLALSLVLSFHPEDHPFFLRNRLPRWWRRVSRAG